MILWSVHTDLKKNNFHIIEKLIIFVSDFPLNSTASTPSFFLCSIKNGQFRQYKGGRKETELVSFVDDKKWEELDPIPWYFSPASVQ